MSAAWDLADRESILARFDAIGETVLGGREAAEANGRLDDRVVAALRDAGICRLFHPQPLGGWEVDPVTCAKVTESLAQRDTAAAWMVMVANAARLMSSRWPDALVEEVWADDPDVMIAASGNRAFRAEAVTNGYRVSGVNGFVSGCHFARWFMSPAIADDGTRMMVVLPMAECEILDTWQVLGMRGTGSNDVRAPDVFVPAHRAVMMAAEPAPRHPAYAGALYRCPGRVVFATYVPVSLTLARMALDIIKDVAADKIAGGDGGKVKDRTTAQLKFGQAVGDHRASYGYFMNALEEAWQRALTGREATPVEKADLYLAGTHGVQASARVVRTVADIAGTTALYESHPLARIVRDMEMLRHHGFANENRFASVAQVYWGAELDYPLLLR